MKSKRYFTFSKLIFQLVIILGFTDYSIAQVYGCTDPLSQNFDPWAEINDGSCTYVNASISNITSISLSDSLNESSGLIQFDGRIWSHNDNNDNLLYAINPTTGSIDSTINISGVFNDDWEEISQDVNYIYLGDFGNNSHGNRTDLHILRILKSGLPFDLQIDTIYFHYPEQTDFNNQTNNSSNFDCESFIVSSDSIFLFTKRWGDKRTLLYGFPKVPGNYAAHLKDSFDIQGLITGATFLENEKLISICGYSSTLQPFVWLLYDFPGTNFFKGNKRKISLPLSYTQVEAITTLDGLNYYASNEYFINGPIVSPQRFHAFNLALFLEGYLTGNYAEVNQIEKEQILIYPNPSTGKFIVQTDYKYLGDEFLIYNLSGNLIQKRTLSTENLEIDLMENGIYFLKWRGTFTKIIVN